MFLKFKFKVEILCKYLNVCVLHMVFYTEKLHMYMYIYISLSFYLAISVIFTFYFFKSDSSKLSQITFLSFQVTYRLPDCFSFWKSGQSSLKVPFQVRSNSHRIALFSLSRPISHRCPLYRSPQEWGEMVVVLCWDVFPHSSQGQNPLVWWVNRTRSLSLVWSGAPPWMDAHAVRAPSLLHQWECAESWGKSLCSNTTYLKVNNCDWL